MIKVSVGLQMNPEKIKVIREWEGLKIKKKKGTRLFRVCELLQGFYW